jgi:two-component system nitrate/nitrite response regulator NarL
VQPVATFIVHPDRLFREGLGRLFHETPFQVVGQAASLADAIGLVPTVRPDLVLLEWQDRRDALTSLAALRLALPHTPMLVLTSDLSEDRLAVALDHGMDGFLSISLSRTALLASLELAMLGEKVFPSQLAGMIVGGRIHANTDTPDRHGLSGREAQIVGYLIRGLTNKAIAGSLDITEATVKMHLKSVLRKIVATNRTQAAIWGLSHGFAEGTSLPMAAAPPVGGRLHLEAASL